MTSDVDFSLDLALLARVRSDEAATSMVPEILWLANEQDDIEGYLRSVLPLLAERAGLDYLALARAQGGEWTTAGATGQERELPLDLLADALDREAQICRDGWLITHLGHQAGGGQLLAGFGDGPQLESAAATLAAVSPVVARGLSIVRGRQLHARRIRRLEAILEIAGTWNQTHEMEPLLVQMAEAATRLLQADRASIFLWDKPNKTLVARPALGVEDGELRIPDDAGLVGKVVQSGEPGRVDRSHGQDQIDRRVGKKLGYETQTLLCVPLRGGNSEIFGAFEVLNKADGDFTNDDQEALQEMAGHAAIALENTQERAQLLSTRRQMSEEAAQGVQLIGDSPAIDALRSTIRRVAETDLAVLILGENGTGKEVVSRSIHYLGERRDEPFIAVNCAAISETLLESELFGHEKGSFTGADETREGKFELASGGTLFLDEIGDMSLGGQSKLLRVLEQKEVVRVGGSRPIHTDARVIAATNQDLTEMVKERRFRQDLLFRLNVVTLDLPPLRERTEDVLLLAEHFLSDFCQKKRRKPPRITADARRRLQKHTWPGNVRELRNLMERLAYLTDGDTIELQDLGFILTPADETPAWVASDLTLSEATMQFQTEYIKKAITRSKHNMTEAAERLGLHRANLYRKMRQLKMGTDSKGEEDE